MDQDAIEIEDTCECGTIQHSTHPCRFCGVPLCGACAHTHARSCTYAIQVKRLYNLKPAPDVSRAFS